MMRHGDDGGFQTESVGAGLVRRLMSLLCALVLQTEPVVNGVGGVKYLTLEGSQGS
jgi:hypothetical protein